MSPLARAVRVLAPVSPRALSMTGGWRLALLYVALTALMLLYLPTLQWLFGRWTMSVWHHAHGLFIPPIVAYFVWQELRRRAHLPAVPSALGFALVAPALVVHALDAGMHTQLLSAVSLVLVLPGVSLLLLGTAHTRAILFPLAFLVLALPIPLALTEPVHWQLRLLVAAAIDGIVPMLGVPIFVEGTTVETTKGRLLIADACSGFSTLYASVAIAVLTAYAAETRARRMLVLLAAAPVAIAANVLRVTMLVLMTAWWGPHLLDTPLHPLSGMMTFAIALPVILWLGGPSTTSRS